MMIFAIDTGNDKIKTESIVMQAGLKKLDYVPDESENAIFYEGCYYVETLDRLTYLYDKTVDDRYYILTLLALAKELEILEKSGKQVPNSLIRVALLVGLPPAHYSALRRKFAAYFYRNGKPINFRYNGRNYNIVFSEVDVNVQGYAVYLALSSKMRLNDFDKVCVIDLGGMTLDYLVLRYGQLDRTDSLEMGMIVLYRKIKSAMNRQYNMLIDEADIANILQGKPTGYPDKVKEQIYSMAKDHMMDVIGIFREMGIDLYTTLVIFVGGGSIALKDVIVKVYNGRHYIIDDICANAKGYKLKYLAEHQQVK